jgi:hypothetical protein
MAKINVYVKDCCIKESVFARQNCNSSSVIPELRKRRLKDFKFKSSLRYIVRPHHFPRGKKKSVVELEYN